MYAVLQSFFILGNSFKKNLIIKTFFKVSFTCLSWLLQKLSIFLISYSLHIVFQIWYVYCFENGSNQNEKNVQLIEICFFKFEADDQEFAIFLKPLKQFLNRIFFQLLQFSYLDPILYNWYTLKCSLEQKNRMYKIKWEKVIEFEKKWVWHIFWLFFHSWFLCNFA